MSFLEILRERNTDLFYFGLLNLAAAIIMIIISRISTVEVYNVNAWYKPIKFALSTWLLSWSMGWYTGHLELGSRLSWFNWIIIITLLWRNIVFQMQ